MRGWLRQSTAFRNDLPVNQMLMQPTDCRVESNHQLCCSILLTPCGLLLWPAHVEAFTGVLASKLTSLGLMVGLQGTPVQNTLTELFALLHFLDPSEFPDPEQSAQEFAQVDAQGGAVFKDKGGMEQQVSRIHELLQPR